MSGRCSWFLALGCAGVLAAASAAAGDPVNVVAPGSLTTNSTEAFTSLGVASTNHDAILSFTGIHFGERFAGQTVSPSGSFDMISGTASSPLTVVAGAAGQNLVSQTSDGVNPWLTGLSHFGFPNGSAVGEGAFAVRFDTLQSEVGFTTVGANGGDMTVSFFGLDGSLIQTLLVGVGSGNLDHAFQRDGGAADIAGLLITNANGGGIAFDDFRYDVNGQVIPLPSALWIGMAGMGAVVGTRRRRPLV